ncbi:hypothetical protein C1H46_006521 [Malus baccata]|uniref:Carbonic anhydrase n=1 Tax=Malus baccata TaxID=106549 RepID=A0A540NA00_MALBA|nr:hypothetical protein C1H46_006521 [Malus baccata]
MHGLMNFYNLEWEGDAGSIQINGTEYFLNECHWHTPSEHTINGIRYDLELHVVHRSADKNSVAVIAFLYQVGPPNSFLLKVNIVSREQLELLQQVVDDYAVMSARPLQPANGRGIKLYVPSLTLSDDKVPHTTIKAASSPQGSINAASPKSSQSPIQVVFKQTINLPCEL